MKHWLIPAGIVGAIVVLGLVLWGNANAIRNEAINKETQLSAEYRSNQNDLSAFISTFHEQVGIADRKTEQLDRVILDAVQGRYGANGYGANGSLMNAIKEAYPDARGLDIYDKIMDTIKAGRDEFKGKQDKLLDELRDYDNWRAQGILRSWALGNFFPSHNLRAQIGDKVYYGPEAEDHMRTIVLTQEATQAYDSGTMAPMTAEPLPPRAPIAPPAEAPANAAH